MGNISIRNGKLSFFDNVAENRDLAKFRSASASHEVRSVDGNIIITNTAWGSSTSVASFNSLIISGAGNNEWSASMPKAPGLFSKICAFIKQKRKKHASSVFPLFRANAETMKVMELKAERIESAIKTAKGSYQTALAEKIKEDADLRLIEDRMILGGFNRCVTEAQVVELFDKCDTDPLSLTYIANYVKPLPPDVAASLAKAEEMCLFDNYAILHFDPLGEGDRLTREEEIRRRDPILFGVIRDSRKLYFIADWIDEQCKLTMEVLVDKLGIQPGDVEMKEKVKVG